MESDEQVYYCAMNAPDSTQLQENVAYGNAINSSATTAATNKVKIVKCRRLMITVTLTVTISVTIAAIALLLSNTVSFRSFKVQSQNEHSASQEHISTIQTLLSDVNTEIKIVVDQLQNSTRLLGEQINDLLSQLAVLNRIQTTTKEKSICGPGNWQRIAYLNMSDPSHQCPPVWREYSGNGVRACGRPTNASAPSCYSMYYSPSLAPFIRVCGKVIGYQVGSTDAFKLSTINNSYVDGVSITYGSPRTHIWSYASGLSETLIRQYETESCPCRLAGTSFLPQYPPSFVGSNYYCESGNPTNTYQHTNALTYTDDPLWDGQNCEGQCCSDGRTPPWFSVQLTNATAVDIEVRICGSERSSQEDTPINILEIYVQ